MTGKYASMDDVLFSDCLTLEGDCFPKIDDVNNCCLCGWFLSPILQVDLLHTYGFIHGLDFYGSYLGIKGRFSIQRRRGSRILV